jgi:chromate transport protein ChrA
MYGLSVGISKVNEILPRPAYALLSGLNSATVGIIALAAVQLAQKAITDKVTRILVFLGATAGLLYNALWYFPLLMFLAGSVTVIWDFRWLHGPANKVMRMVSRQHGADEREEVEMNPTRERPQNDKPGPSRDPQVNKPVDASASPEATSMDRATGRTHATSKGKQRSELPTIESEPSPPRIESDESEAERVVPADRDLNISWQFGAVLIIMFFMTFTVIMVLRGVLKNRPLLLSLFANLYLAGTIIFGGGPVVIPLLRE